ncbi:MAG: AI-2E family transporter [Polyangiaceae bacterium]|nr:AI-2E family transporter [Polyangiaceae bacterium]
MLAFVRAPRREILLSRGLWLIAAILAFGFVLHGLRAVLTPIFLAFLIAYVLDPVVDRLERWHIPRALGIVLVLFTVLGATLLFFALVVPAIVSDVASFARELPGRLTAGFARVEPILQRYGIQVPHTAAEAAQALQGKTEQIANQVLAPIGSAAATVIGGTVSVIGAAAAALLVPIMAFYLLYDFDPLIEGVRDLLPVRWREPVSEAAKEVDTVLGQFVRGQVMVMGILAVLYGGAYWALGIRLAIPIGIMAGILNFIPYVGSAFALVAGLLMSLLGGLHWGQIVGVLISYAVVQSLEGFVITPKIVGKTVGLSDIWVLIALFVAGEIFGFLGVLLAVPAAAVAKIFIVRALRYYKTTKLYLESEPEPGSVLAGILCVPGLLDVKAVQSKKSGSEPIASKPGEPVASEPGEPVASEPPPPPPPPPAALPEKPADSPEENKTPPGKDDPPAA